MALSVLAACAWFVCALLLADVVGRVFLHGATLGAVAEPLAAIGGLLLSRAALLCASEEVAERAADTVERSLRDRVVTKLFALGPAYARGSEERGNRIDAASTVKGTSAPAEISSAVCVPSSVANLPHISEPTTIEPKNTIWCIAMPRARMKLGRIICTDAPLLAMTVIQQAPESAMQAPTT